MRIAAVIVTNAARTRFLVQRKDATYRYPFALALFGGAVEAGESDAQALQRELVEELGPDSARLLVDAGLSHVREFDVGYPFVLFEAVVSDTDLDVMAARPVFEGERAEIVESPLLLRQGWMPRLVEVLVCYVDMRHPRTRP